MTFPVYSVAGKYNDDLSNLLQRYLGWLVDIMMIYWTSNICGENRITGYTDGLVSSLHWWVRVMYIMMIFSIYYKDDEQHEERISYAIVRHKPSYIQWTLILIHLLVKHILKKKKHIHMNKIIYK